jgi:hypothetical protein
MVGFYEHDNEHLGLKSMKFLDLLSKCQLLMKTLHYEVAYVYSGPHSVTLFEFIIRYYKHAFKVKDCVLPDK